MRPSHRHQTTMQRERALLAAIEKRRRRGRRNLDQEPARLGLNGTRKRRRAPWKRAR